MDLRDGRGELETGAFSEVAIATIYPLPGGDVLGMFAGEQFEGLAPIFFKDSVLLVSEPGLIVLNRRGQQSV